MHRANQVGCPQLFFLSPFTFASSLARAPVYGLGAAIGIAVAQTCAAPATSPEPGEHAPVSYYREVRPIFQAQCQGCHQPAKAKGGFVMTEFQRLLVGGESEGKAIVPGAPAKSALMRMITPVDGAAEMPKGKPPLTPGELALVTRWIQQGAQDDTPADAQKHYDAEHPPTYARPPVIASLDFSPGGEWLAVAGFHEVLLHRGDGSGLAARLVGMSERIQAVRFSPDGRWLAAVGGNPARSGEVQFWDVAQRKLAVSVPVAYDTLYGVSWSPDSKQVAFGCPDNTVRVIEAGNGKQVLQMGSHNDWPLATAFSVKGDYVISGGRDMSVKLTELATQRFIDNVTSITPGALKGGVLALATHPQLEHIVTGGADGLPKVYRIFRESARMIGDDAQFIGDLFPMAGRVFSVRFSPDGRRIVSGSSIDGRGEVLVCSYDFTNDVPKQLRDLMGKVPKSRKPEEQQQLDAYRNSGIREIARVKMPTSGVFAVAFRPDGEVLAAGGADGRIRLIQATNGAVLKEVLAVEVADPATLAAKPRQTSAAPKIPSETAVPAETLPKGAATALEVHPGHIALDGPNEQVQLVVLARLSSGESLDVTRAAEITVAGRLAEVSSRGLLRPHQNGSGSMRVTWAGKTAEVPLEITGYAEEFQPDFIRDVNPVLAKLGCNAGTCHGAKDGKNGFKLSLRGYDPEFDLRSFTDDLASRRVNLASPEDSLMLLKASAEVPHEGGRRTAPGERYYEILRRWILDGAKLDLQAPRVVKLELSPANPVVQQIGTRQQVRVVATYSDGRKRDVTREAFIESGNTDVVTAEDGGLLSTLRRGEAPVLARYEGNYAATTLTVMGDRTGFVWVDPATWGRIDELVAAKWKRLQILPSELCTDSEFLRRVYLDLTGLPPTPEQVQAFLADSREARRKRDEVIQQLIGSPDYIEHWANKWADLLQCNSKFLGKEGAELFRQWIRTEVEQNTPYDAFARKILTATGSNRENPPASYWKILRAPADAMENTTHLFLATRFNCNKCHDHPFERWTQDQYYELSAYFAQVSLASDPASQDRKVGGTDVEAAKPLFERIADAANGEVKHERTGKVTAPRFPFPAQYPRVEKASRREELAAWVTSPDNRFFAASYVNRLWGYLTGVGLIEPLDDLRAGNPPSNPELLDFLTREFISSGFNTRHVIALICQSRTYQLSIRSNRWNQDDTRNYAHATARRLPAESLVDAVFRVTGATPSFSGAKTILRAAQLPDAGMDVGSGLLATLGRPARESACECERSSDVRLGSVMALLSGPTVSGAINDRNNALAKLVATQPDDRELINAVFLRILNRPARPAEIDRSLALLQFADQDHATLTNRLGPLEEKMKPVIAALEQQRLNAIALAQTNLAVYEQDTAFLRSELEKRRQQQIAAAERELKDYERLLPAQVALWESQQNLAESKTTWTLLEPKEITASGGVKLAQQKDGSLLASGANGQSEYRLIASTAFTNVTGVMLEVLPDESLPRFGPGRFKDGNFVLSELDVKWARGTNSPENVAKLSQAKVDFAQKEFAAEQLIDGKIEAGRNGWAIAGAPGVQRHWATFKFDQPLAHTNGVTLRVKLHHRFGDGFTLGRFRVWVTAASDPLEFGLPENLAQAARAPAGERKPEQVGALFDFYRAGDKTFWKHKQALASAKEPLPTDPRLTTLKRALSQAEEPIRLDPELVQLRQDTAASAQQQTHKRLTLVQDLAWALINSSAFLFNH